MNSRRAIRLTVVAVVIAASAARQALAQPAGDATALFRVILQDGTALVSLGEFTRVADRVIFSMPLGAPRGDRLQLVNLPAAVVNWESTMRYAEATRYAQYVATRAESDFARLAGDVARTLNEIPLAREPARRLRIAEDMRRVLLGWPADHFGYRSEDVLEMDAILEGLVSELRPAAGAGQFGFSLVATIRPPALPLLPDPTLAQSIEQVLLAARLSDIPAERLTLLRTVVGAIDESRKQLPNAWARRTRATAQEALAADVKTESGYAGLARAAVQQANAAAAAADVRRVERVIATVRERDARLGQLRTDHVTGLIALLQERLDSARRLRLMRDQWAQKVPSIRAYRAAVAGPVDRLARLGRKLEDVRALAGPDVGSLPRLIQQFEGVCRQLGLVRPPPDMAAAHATLISAAELGQQALRIRERAATVADLAVAWDASSAAAGSLMLLAQARRQIELVSRPPERP